MTHVLTRCLTRFMTQTPQFFRSCVIGLLLLLAVVCPARSEVERDRILLIAGGPSHGYGEHEYRAGAELIRDALAGAQDRFELVVHSGWPEPAALERAAAVVLSMDGWRAHLALPHLEQLEREARRGMGIMALHWAVHVPSGESGRVFLELIGGYYETDFSTNPKWSARLAIDARHPVGRGVGELEIFDEWYFNIRFRDGMAGVVPIATAVPSDDDRSRVSAFLPWASPPPGIRQASGRRETLIWAVEREDGGRGLGFTGGHFHWNFGNDAFRRLLLNAVLWVAGGEVPEGGVPSETPSFEQLRANQDEGEPFWFDADEIGARFGLLRESGHTSRSTVSPCAEAQRAEPPPAPRSCPCRACLAIRAGPAHQGAQRLAACARRTAISSARCSGETLGVSAGSASRSSLSETTRAVGVGLLLARW
jgi:hypothetical protein